jgi:ABC-2 type transport system ATP-binding protein
MPAIEVEHLTKTYGPARGIQDISFSIDKGEIMGFLGPNGSGKTTTMRILTCFFPPTSGTARVCGHDILQDPFAVRRATGYLPETVPLYLDMTVTGYLHFFAEIKGMPRRARAPGVAEVIERCGLETHARRMIGMLSKGYRQRVGIAQALLGNPQVLILDEPTVGLDPRQIADIRSLIKGLGGEQTVILSTHILPEVSMTCDRVIIIYEGRLLALDTPANLVRHIQEIPRLYLEADGPADAIAVALRRLDGVRSVSPAAGENPSSSAFTLETEPGALIANDIARCVLDGGWALRTLAPDSMTLEEIFIQLIDEQERERA